MRAQLAIGATLVALLGSTPAFADAIVLSDSRTVSGFVSDFQWSDSDGEVRYDDAFFFTASGPQFSASYSHVSPLLEPPPFVGPLSELVFDYWSLVSGSSIALRGSGYSDARLYETYSSDDPHVQIGGGWGSTDAKQVLSVKFQIANPHTFTFVGDLVAMDVFEDFAFLSLCGNGECPIGIAANDVNNDHALSGVLEPGVYEFYFLSRLFQNPDDHHGAGHDWDLTLELTPIPEPGTLLLLATGVLGSRVFLRRRSQRPR